MSSLSSASTRDEVLAAIADNASYEEDSSLPKAKAYLTALMIWKNRWAFDESYVGSSKMRFDMINRTLPDDIDRVRSWISAASATSNPTQSSSGYSLVDVSGGRR